jgi:hypothetical protein
MKLLFSPFDLRSCNCFSDTLRAQAEDDGSLKDGIIGGLKDPASLSDCVDEERVHIFGFKLSEIRSGERSNNFLHRKRILNPAHKAEGLGLNHDITLLAQRHGLAGYEVTVLFDVHNLKPPILKGFKP